jgi:hypothetical protein
MARKENKKIIETLEFDNAAFAQDVINESTQKLERVKKGLIISGVATGFTLLSKIFETSSFAAIFIMLAFFGAIAAYIVGGGMKIALKTAVKLGKFGWFVCPFPVDIFTGILTIIFSMMAFMFFPVVFVYLNYRQHKKNIEAAEQYLGYCRPVAATEVACEPVEA